MSDPSLQLVQRHRKIEPRTSAKSVLSRYLRGKPLIEPSVPAAASRAAPPLRNRIEPMEEEGAVGELEEEEEGAVDEWEEEGAVESRHWRV